MYLFFDTETTGLPLNWRAPASDTANWPRLVQLAWIAADQRGVIMQWCSLIIRPSGFQIPSSASAVHGITNERALREGVCLTEALETFARQIEAAAVLVAHNIDFDANVVGAEFHRTIGRDPLERKQRRCTMRESTDYCQIPGPYGYKWPTLEELHLRLFGTRIDGAHDAFRDCVACMRCFVRLKELGLIP